MAKGADEDEEEKREQDAPRGGNLHAHLSNAPGVKAPVSDSDFMTQKGTFRLKA
jgi:hypothetical protein